MPESDCPLSGSKGLPPPLRATSQYHLPLGTPTQQQMPMAAAMGGVPTAEEVASRVDEFKAWLL